MTFALTAVNKGGLISLVLQYNRRKYYITLEKLASTKISMPEKIVMFNANFAAVWWPSFLFSHAEHGNSNFSIPFSYFSNHVTGMLYRTWLVMFNWLHLTDLFALYVEHIFSRYDPWGHIFSELNHAEHFFPLCFLFCHLPFIVFWFMIVEPIETLQWKNQVVSCYICMHGRFYLLFHIFV